MKERADAGSLLFTLASPKVASFRSMSIFARILVPVDGSPQSERAVDLASTSLGPAAAK